MDICSKAIKAVDRWLEVEFGEKTNKGPIARLSLQQFAEEEIPSEKEQTKIEKIESPKASLIL